MKKEIDFFELFLQLSEQLTAFTSFQLVGTGEARSYYNTTLSIIGEDLLRELLLAFHSIQEETNDEVGFDRALRHQILSDLKLGPIARNMIKMWFVGTWYQLPDTWREKYGVSAEDKTFVVSANAYREGLLWPTIGAHPMGAKAPGYGTWSAPPSIPSINDSLNPE